MANFDYKGFLQRLMPTTEKVDPAYQALAVSCNKTIKTYYAGGSYIAYFEDEPDSSVWGSSPDIAAQKLLQERGWLSDGSN